LRGDGERLGMKIFVESNHREKHFSIYSSFQNLLGVRNKSFFLWIGGSRTKQKQ
jgi:hypothetical protein